MGLLSFVVVLLALSLDHSLAASVNPGFRTAITNKGLNYVMQVGVPILEQQLSSIDIPDVSGSADVKIGKIKYKLKNIKLTDFTIAEASLNTSTETGLVLKASGVSLHVTADWSYKLHSFIPASDHGSLKASASGASLSVSVIVGADNSGHATLSSTGCSLNAGHINVKFHGGASWLYNLFDKTIADQIKHALNDQGCKAAKDAINKNGNKALESLPVVVPLDEISEISYALLRPPNFTSCYIQTDHKGEFLWRAHPDQGPPFSPPLLPYLAPSEVTNNKMMFLWATDYVANTAALVYQKAGMLQYTITPDMVPSNPLFGLNTKSFSLLIPQLYKKFPDKNLKLVVNASKPPVVEILPGGANFTLFGDMDFYVMNNSTSQDTLAFTLGVVAVVDATPRLEAKNGKQLLKVNATYLSATLSLVHSNIGSFDVNKIQAFFDLLTKTTILKKLNSYGNKGLPLPAVDGVSFLNPAVSLGKGYAVIATDFNYKPSFF